MAEKITILAKYLDYSNIFSKELAAELLKHFDINKHLINLKLCKQPFHNPIYSLEPVKLEIFKTYIKINFANSFI